MVIVNQDKSGVYNFDNIKSIDVLENEVNITDDILSNKGIVIGRYETEKRAKEVIQEIITRYKNWENLKAEQPGGRCLPVYEMPKE